MAVLNRVLFNILCKDVAASAAFYRELIGLEEVFRNIWYVVMSPPGQPMVQIGLIDQVSEFTPRHAWGTHNGSYLTLVVDDVVAVLQRARSLGVEIIEEPVAQDHGVTRALIRDPNGLVLDLSTPTELVAGRGADFVATPKMTAIDQQQPEERGRSTLA